MFVYTVCGCVVICLLTAEVVLIYRLCLLIRFVISWLVLFALLVVSY